MADTYGVPMVALVMPRCACLQAVIAVLSKERSSMGSGAVEPLCGCHQNQRVVGYWAASSGHVAPRRSIPAQPVVA
jgi:hypothetical protein